MSLQYYPNNVIVKENCSQQLLWCMYRYNYATSSILQCLHLEIIYILWSMAYLEFIQSALTMLRVTVLLGS